MGAFRHVACCIDASRSGGAALEEARGLSDAVGGRLSLVHAGPYTLTFEEVDGRRVPVREDLNAGARDWLRRRAGEIPGAEPVFLQGERGPAACAWAEEAGADLIVVGAGSGRLPGLVPGGFVHHLLEHAPCPVLVVRPRVRGGAAPSPAGGAARR